MDQFRHSPNKTIEDAGGLMFFNDTYTVVVTPLDGDMYGPVHLSIKRNDKSAVHDWRDLQTIKNIMMGDEREAIEIYPAESRLVDTANQYHLWVIPADWELPFGFTQREIGGPEQAAAIGAKHRPWPDTEAPIYTPDTGATHADIRRPSRL